MCSLWSRWDYRPDKVRPSRQSPQLRLDESVKGVRLGEAGRRGTFFVLPLCPPKKWRLVLEWEPPGLMMLESSARRGRIAVDEYEDCNHMSLRQGVVFNYQPIGLEHIYIIYILYSDLIIVKRTTGLKTGGAPSCGGHKTLRSAKQNHCHVARPRTRYVTI